MSDPIRTDAECAHDPRSAVEREARIEQLLLDGLDHYFAGRYADAINVWTRVLFLDRSHARARAYIERARTAMAERLRHSDALLHDGLAAFDRGDGDEARRLLTAAIEDGAPREEALAILGRLDRLGPAVVRRAAPVIDLGVARSAEPAEAPTIGRWLSRSRVPAIIATALVAAMAWSVWAGRSWLFGEHPEMAVAPVSTDLVPPPPGRGEMAVARARALAASGRLRDAVVLLESVKDTDPLKGDADRLRADLQRQLLSISAATRGVTSEAEAARR